jgi:hypothetical protein
VVFSSRLNHRCASALEEFFAMKRLESSSGLNGASVWSTAEPESRGLVLLSGATRSSERSIWTLAIAGLVFAVVAANLLCLSPRWYSNRFIAFVYEPARFVVLTAATGAAAVQIFWELLNRLPSAGRMRIVRNLSGAWVFLPCFVLLYEQNSPWMLFVVALVAVGMAFGLRRLVPTDAPVISLPEHSSSALPSLDGLPPGDSPLLLAFWIAIFLQASMLAAAGGSLLTASYALSISVFLLAWRWSAFDPRAVELWVGAHPPLRQAAVAMLLTSFTLVPFAIGGDIGFLGLHRAHIKVTSPPKPAEASYGFYGIVLYPPPKKKEIIAPMPHTDSLRAGVMTKPLNIPFDGQYWYFKAPNRRPGDKAHIAHGQPIDANINPHSTDAYPLQMEAHQTLSEPIDLSCCSEIDIAITNADTHPGEIALLALVRNSTVPGKPMQLLGQQTIPSSQPDHIPADRAPVKEVLRFAIPHGRTLRQFDEISILFTLAPRRARIGAKVSIDSFELIPK